MEVVHPTQCLHTCQASSGQGECPSRLGVSSHERLKRLDARQTSLPAVGRAAGAIQHRSVCLTDQCSVGILLQLEARPSCNDSGRNVDIMEGPLPVPFPPIRLDIVVPEQDQRRENISGTDSTSVAKPSVVSHSSQLSSRSTAAAASNTEHPDQPGRQESPTCSNGPPTLSRVACLRESYRAGGLSEGVVQLLRSSWRSSTETAYSSAWRQWDSWCTQRGLDPLSAPVSSVLEFLFCQYTQGKQYRTINTIRSAISMTHQEVDGTRVGQHPLVTRLLKGVFNSRPPALRYSSTWDVDMVLAYLKSLSQNEELTFATLSHKLAMLMALTNADRCSDFWI